MCRRRTRRDDKLVSAMIVGYCCAALWFNSQVLWARPIAPPPSPVSRASLRRAVPSFTVEVRRRPRLATKANQDLQLSDTKTRPAAFESESHRLAAATFGAAKTPNQPSGDGAASYPKRRILQSLVPEKPPGGQLQDALLSAGASHPMSQAQKPTSVGPIKGKDHTSTSPRKLEASSELTAQLPTDHRLGPFDHPRRRATGQRFRQTCRRRRRITSSETPAVRRRAQRRNGESGSRSLSMPARSLFPPKTKVPSRKRTPWERSRRPSTTFRVQIESEPSWVAMSSAMNSSPANAGSGAYPRDGETRQNNRSRQRAYSGRSSAPARHTGEFGLPRSSRLRLMAVLMRNCLDDPLIG